MKKLWLLMAAGLFITNFCTLADATQFTLSNYAINANNSDPGLVVQIQNVLNVPYNFSLAEGESTSYTSFFDIWTNENSIDDNDQAPKSITVDLVFSTPSANGQAEGQTVGAIEGIWGRKQWGEVTWDIPAATIYYGNGGELLVYLTDVKFNYGGLWGTYPGECAGATVKIKFMNLKDSAVPEPTTILLLGAGFMGLAAMRSRRRSTST